MTISHALLTLAERDVLGWTILILMVCFWVQTAVEADLWRALRVQHTQSPVGKALTYKVISLAAQHLALGALFLVFGLRLITPDRVFILTEPGRLLLYAIVIVSTLSAAGIGVVVSHRLRENGIVTVDKAGVFATLASAMPMVVADCTGTIQYATPSLDALVGAAQDELTGQNLTALMPERWRAQHRDGLEHYLTTGESRIMGRIVSVDLLRRDGTEIPASLALASSEVDGEAWFVGALWARGDEESLEVKQP
jgi:PAS domain S-box-containing protein